MSSSIASRNSEAAAKLALKKKEQLERANKLRNERNKLKSEFNLNDNSVSHQNMQQDYDCSKALIQTYNDSHGNPVAERIIIRNPNNNLQISRNNNSDLSFDSLDKNKNSLNNKEVVANRINSNIRNNRNNFETERNHMYANQHRKPLAATYEEEQHPYSNAMEINKKNDDYQPNIVSFLGGKMKCTIPNTLHCSTSSSDMHAYRHPPRNDQGICLNLCDRPILCMSINQEGNDVVVGGTNHSCYHIDKPYNLQSNSSNRSNIKEMYSKRQGHSEWITGIAHIGNNSNKVMSVGMDSKICVWGSHLTNQRTKCVGEYTGVHFGSISKVLTDSVTGLAYTAGYDGKINLWSFEEDSIPSGSSISNARSVSSVRNNVAVSNTAPIVGTYSAGNAPITDICYNKYELSACTRDGGILFWDVCNSSGEPHRKIKGHSGSINIVSYLSNRSDTMDSNHSMFVTGGADGLVKLWDSRMAKPLVASVPAHCGGNERGPTPAVSCLSCALDNTIITGGTDSIINVFDIRSLHQDSSNAVHSWNYHKNGVYSLCVPTNMGHPNANGVILSGDGMGMLHCYNIFGDRQNDAGLLYGLGVCQQGAIQCIGIMNGPVPKPISTSYRSQSRISHDTQDTHSSRGNPMKIVCTGDDGNISFYDF